MSSISIAGDTSGSVILTVPAAAGSGTITLPAGTGTAAVQGVSTNIVSGTAVASTSGTSIDFTSIPSWVKRITVMYNGISTSGTSNVQVQLGAGSVTTSGYTSQASTPAGTVASSTTGLLLTASNAATDIISGLMTIATLGSNVWVCSSVARVGTSTMRYSAGDVTLSGTLDRVRITTVGGTDTFDAGTINILYE